MDTDHAKFIQDLSFGEKARFFSYDYLKCLLYLVDCPSEQNIFTKSLYSKLITSSHLLEDFLDFHGVKNNSDWYFYRELAAVVRHISLAGYAQKHISNRLALYDIDNDGQFGKSGVIAHRFITASLMKLAPVVLEEAGRLKIRFPGKRFTEKHFPEIATGEMLAHNFEDEEKSQDTKRTVWVANQFLSIAGDFDAFEFFETCDKERLKSLVPERINEVEMRRFEMLVHNLQSSFDTYVIHGGYLLGNRNLKKFRAYFSVIYHLLRVMGRVLHFYERHLMEVGYKHIYRKAQRRLAELVDPDALLDCTINYCLYYVNHFFSLGRDLAQKILQENVERSSVEVNVPMDLGFHCRPSLLVAKIVQKYGGQVEMVVGGDRFDAGSVLDIQWAGGKIQKENIKKVVFEGDVRALKDIETLASVNYGEDRMGKGIPLPKALHYLR